MKTVRIVLAALLSVGVIVLGAFLPAVVAKLQALGTEHVIYAEKEPVSLQIRELSMLEKLSCILDSQHMYLSDDNANIPREELWNVVASEMELYQAAELVSPAFHFEDQKHWIMEAELVAFYNKSVPDRSAVVWLINMQTDYYGSTTLQLVLDDATGAVLLIEFLTSETYYSPKRNYDVLIRFYTIYFERLGVPLGDVNVIELEPVETGKTGVEVTRGWNDDAMGTMRIHFTVEADGFYVELYGPDLQRAG